ncbi:hypothetical protein PGT21_000635 [Puccinia graminis f. sp. tritici]|uniref:Uncharacterized protein n=1 Tax=Puccinia graminis f. sp. tritici TaxID=56615 RepID=A0A5B0LWE2_PUCGR|nr:hypothetical protein PGT21_000635 [Puccinia graminis f. sp. tritici]
MQMDNPTSCQPTSHHVSLQINVDTDPLILPTPDRLPTNDTSKCPRPSQAARVVRFLVLAGFIFDDPRRLRGSSDSSFWLVLSVTTLAGCEETVAGCEDDADLAMW